MNVKFNFLCISLIFLMKDRPVNFNLVVPPPRLERGTSGSTIQRSNQLS